MGRINTTCGGILGGTGGFTYTKIPNVTLSNCYTYGSVTDASSGLIATGLQTKISVITSNCYIANGSWSDASANTLLLGTSDASFNPGTIWTDISSNATNVPYVLSSFNQPIYDPSMATISNTSYTSSSGLFQPDYKYSIINSDATNLSINSNNGILSYSNVNSGSTTNVFASKYDASNNNYPYQYNINKFTINVSQQTQITTTISVSSTISKTYGDAAFNLGATSNSDAPFSYVSSNTSVATIHPNSGVVTIIGGGVATINITQGENANYTSASATSTISVSQQTTTISVSSTINKTYGDADFNLGATSNSNAAISYISSNTNVATIDPTTGVVTIVGFGSTIITTSQNQNANYTSASATCTISVSKIATNILVPSSISKTYRDAPFNLAATSNSNESFNYSSSNTNVATIDSTSGLVTIIGDGVTTITTSQLENSIYTSAYKSTIMHVGIIIDNTYVLSNICFLGNTPIKVDQGTFAISQLKEGIHSINGKLIKRITATKTNDKHLICIEKHALAMNVPSQKTIITANHKIMYKGKMVKSKDLIGLVDNVYKTKYRGETLYNVLLKTHETMNVNNMICETLSPENTIVQLYDILDKIPAEYHADIIVQFNNQINEKKLLKNY
jgi:hypothetical protein